MKTRQGFEDSVNMY